MSRSAGIVIGLLVVLVAVLAVTRATRSDDVDRAVIDLPHDDLREPGQTSPRCESPQSVRRACVVAERPVTRPVVIGDVIVAVTGSAAFGLYPATLETVWERPASRGRDPIVAGEDTALLQDTSELVAVDTRDGRIRWTTSLPDATWSSADARVVLTVTDDTVRALEQEDGSLRWSAPARPGDSAVLLTTNLDRVVVADDDPDTPDALRDPITGALLGEQPVDPTLVRLRMARTTGRAAVTSQGSSGVTVRAGPDEVTIARVGGETPGQVLTTETAVVATWSDRVTVHRRSTGELVTTFRALAPEVLATDPFVVHGNGLLYLLEDVLPSAVS